MTESNILKICMLAVSKLTTTTVFRNNTGTGWVGAIQDRSATKITLAEPRPLHSGLCKGSADLIGWTTVEITPDMVGKKVAIFTAIECKSKSGRVTPDQYNFLRQLQKAGGIAGVARGPEDAVDIVQNSWRGHILPGQKNS